MVNPCCDAVFFCSQVLASDRSLPVILLVVIPSMAWPELTLQHVHFITLQYSTLSRRRQTLHTWTGVPLKFAVCAFACGVGLGPPYSDANREVCACVGPFRNSNNAGQLEKQQLRRRSR